MSKKKKNKQLKKVIPNNSRLNIHGYVADRGGCGHIRMIFPFLLLNS